jgi:lipopolysaccharide transport system permease protein
VVFPLEMLSWVAVGTALFHALLALIVLVAALWWTKGVLGTTVLLTPLVLACCVPVLLGLGWLLAALGVFIRDISHVVGAVLSMLLFLSPVLYPASALPAAFAQLLWLNPLTVPIESLRRLLLEGAQPYWQALAAYTFTGLVFCLLAWLLFERLRPAFADEL